MLMLYFVFVEDVQIKFMMQVFLKGLFYALLLLISLVLILFGMILMLLIVLEKGVIVV